MCGVVVFLALARYQVESSTSGLTFPSASSHKPQLFIVTSIFSSLFIPLQRCLPSYVQPWVPPSTHSLTVPELTLHVTTKCIVLLGILIPYTYDRYHAFSTLRGNRPGNLERVYEFKSHEVRFTDQLKNCEDVILKEELGIAFLSCDPGRDRWNTVMVKLSGSFLGSRN